MSSTYPLHHREKAFVVHERPLGDKMEYLQALVSYHPGTIYLETKKGRVFFDLMENLPFISGYGEEKATLCHRITEIVYPLTERLFIHSVSLTLNIFSDTPTKLPKVNNLATYAAISSDRGIVQSCFLSPFVDCENTPLHITSGITVLCEPSKEDEKRGKK